MNQITERKHYLDNLRAFTLILLFPFHIFMIYNNWGENWYIHGREIYFASVFNIICGSWMMPLLFALAGMSSRYALNKRNVGEYAKERVGKLLLPLVFGMLLVVPVQSYIAGLYFNGSASYLDYFTKLTNLSGYDGAFTPGQLWFILYLFVISMVCLPFMALFNKHTKHTNGKIAGRIPLVFLLLLGIIPVCVHPLLNLGGKSLCEFAVYFLLGYFILSSDGVLAKLDKYRFLLLGIFFAGGGLSIHFNYAFYEAVSWLAIMAILGMGRHYLDFTGKITGYLSKSSFGVYLFHQSWIVVAAIFIFKITDNPVLQIPLIFLAAVALTYLTYEGCRRIRIFRWMFGLKE